MKVFDQHIVEIIVIFLLMFLVMGSFGFSKEWSGFYVLALLLIPQGRILSRIGDFKKSGQSRWFRFKFFAFNELLVLTSIIIFTFVQVGRESL
ncbi:MAG: hypothetical protein OEY09_11205 [Gammaproteobacteria bacterium]|nr:hypothetical protein [Gammaproteobacteria bacterium]